MNINSFAPSTIHHDFGFKMLCFSIFQGVWWRYVVVSCKDPCVEFPFFIYVGLLRFRWKKTRWKTTSCSSKKIHMVDATIHIMFCLPRISECCLFRWMFPKIWENPQIIHFNGVFHYFHHPFWGVFFYFWFNTQIKIFFGRETLARIFSLHPTSSEIRNSDPPDRTIFNKHKLLSISWPWTTRPFPSGSRR